MKGRSLNISGSAVSELSELALDGLMTEETYQELMGLLGNAKITRRQTWLDGLENSKRNALTRGLNWVRLFIRSGGSLTLEASTPPFRCECWLCCLEGQGSNDPPNPQ